MKKITQRIISLTLVFGFLALIPVDLNASSTNDFVLNEITTSKDKLVGGWEFTVAGAPEGYESGLMLIVKQGDVYKVQVQLSTGSINGKNIVVQGNKITFDIAIEGDTVSLELVAKGSEISGTSSSPSYGTMKITGTKSISPQ